VTSTPEMSILAAERDQNLTHDLEYYTTIHHHQTIQETISL
jgi:hypothetical protein